MIKYVVLKSQGHASVRLPVFCRHCRAASHHDFYPSPDLKLIVRRKGHTIPGKQSCGNPFRSTSLGTVISSVSGVFWVPVLAFLGFSFFLRKERRFDLFNALLFIFAICDSCLLINGGTKTERTSGSKGGQLFTSFFCEA